MKIERLPQPIPSGDWHDKPLKWTVIGPGDEVQHFRTKKDATTYHRIRKAAPSFREAARLFIFS
jgi:hypothetical protein